jgi:hypothetical protein
MLDRARSAEGLEALVDLHVEFVVRERALIRVWLREQWSLDKDARRASVGQLRQYEGVWREALAARRTDLEPAALGLVVSAVLGMLNTTTHVESPLGAAERTALLRDLAMRALLGQA